MTGDELTGRPWAQAPWELVTAPISAQAFRVAMAIQLHRRPDGCAPFPSQARLAKMTHCSVPTVKRAIAELVEAGCLTCVKRRKAGGHHSTNSYSLKIPRITDDPAVHTTGDHGRSLDGGITDDPAEVDVEVERSSGAAGAAPRWSKAERDEIWDAVEEATGITPEGIGERSLFGKRVKELLEVDATPSEIKSRARRWVMKYPGATLTANALVLHWGELSGRGRKTVVLGCPRCGEAPNPGQSLIEHLYDRHDEGSLCPDCGTVTAKGEKHRCSKQG